MNPAVNALFFTRYVQALADPGRLSSNGVTPTPESEPVVSLRCWSMVTTIDTAFRHVRQHNWQTLSTTESCPRQTYLKHVTSHSNQFESVPP